MKVLVKTFIGFALILCLSACIKKDFDPVYELWDLIEIDPDGKEIKDKRGLVVKDKEIYVFDNSSLELKVFDREGKYKNKIGLNNDLKNCSCFDYESGTWYFLDNEIKRIFLYNDDFFLISAIALPKLEEFKAEFKQIKVIGEDIYLVSDSIDIRDTYIYI